MENTGRERKRVWKFERENRGERRGNRVQGSKE